MGLEVKIKKTMGKFLLEAEFETETGILGILGASGCGKSMTLKAIAGLLTPDEGRIVLNDKVLFDSKQKINLPPQKRQCGYLFQNYALFPNMTVEQNIMSGIKGSTAIRQEKAKEMLELLHLNGLEKQYPYAISGGQQQRTAFARLLASDPEVLLLDEPFSALDSHLKEQLQLQLREILRSYGKTVLLVSHDRSEIYKLSNQVMTMKSGKILQRGTKKEVFENPKDPITARLIGCRNLSKVEKIDKFHLKAVEWGMIVSFKEPLQYSPNTIAIQEQGVSLSKEQQEGENCFLVQVKDCIETRHEYYVLVQAISNENPLKDSKSWIWCTVKKEIKKEPMNFIGSDYWLTIKTEQLLLF